jgi:hypothetical protein
MSDRNTLLLLLFLINPFLLSGTSCTYFQYSQAEIAPLYQLTTSKEITREELKNWDQIAAELIDQNDQEENSTRIFAYLYVAQEDAACLSMQIKKNLAGSIAPLSSQLLKLFFPQATLPPDSSDIYSNFLSNLILSKIHARLVKDLQQTHPYKQKKGEEYWVGKEPFYGQAIGSWKPWIIQSSSQFRAPLPPPQASPEWEEQLRLVKDFCDHASEKEKKSVYNWAGIGMTDGVPNNNGDWREIVNQYLWEQQVPLEKAMLVRAAVAVGRADAAIACFDSKYTYWVKRPDMMDKSLKPMIPVPNHPSYPSGHSTISTTIATILSFFFPDQEQHWNQLAKEAGLSRICAGLHFPLDHEKGQEMGHKIGEQLVERFKQIHLKPLVEPSLDKRIKL